MRKVVVLETRAKGHNAMNDNNVIGKPLLITAREAAQLLSISERTLWDITNRGDLRRVKVGRLVRYDPRDLKAWIESVKVEAGYGSDEQENVPI